MLRRLKFFAMILMILITSNIGNGAPSNDDYAFKTLFLYQFTRYIHWPDNSNQIIIGIVGKDKSVIDAFQRMAAKKSTQNKKIIIKNFSSADKIDNCHMLFIPEPESSKLADITAKCVGKNILIITEKSGLIHHGSCINFTVVDGKLKFELNKAAIKNAGIVVSTQLINLAIVVS